MHVVGFKSFWFNYNLSLKFFKVVILVLKKTTIFKSSKFTFCCNFRPRVNFYPVIPYVHKKDHANLCHKGTSKGSKKGIKTCIKKISF